MKKRAIIVVTMVIISLSFFIPTLPAYDSYDFEKFLLSNRTLNGNPFRIKNNENVDHLFMINLIRQTIENFNTKLIDDYDDPLNPAEGYTWDLKIFHPGTTPGVLPPHAEPYPIIIICKGASGASPGPAYYYMDWMADYYAQKGYVVAIPQFIEDAVYDTSDPDAEFPLIAAIRGDIYALQVSQTIDYLAEKFPGSGVLNLDKVTVMGHSYGGFVSLRAADRDHRIERIALLSAYYENHDWGTTPIIDTYDTMRNLNLLAAADKPALHVQRFTLNSTGCPTYDPACDPIYVVDGFPINLSEDPWIPFCCDGIDCGNRTGSFCHYALYNGPKEEGIKNNPYLDHGGTAIEEGRTEIKRLLDAFFETFPVGFTTLISSPVALVETRATDGFAPPVFYFELNPLLDTAIRGQVTNGGVMPGITINLYKLFPCGGYNQVDTTVTDTEGEYEFTGLADGIYKVETWQPAHKCTIDPLYHEGIAIPDYDHIPYDFTVTCGCLSSPDDISGFESSGCSSCGQFTTGEQNMTSNDNLREYYLKLPEEYDSTTAYPLVFGFHGASGDYTSFTEGYYDFQSVVGEEAILVFPNGLPNAAGLTQWDHEKDLIFFDDLYQELEANICFDIRKVFSVGHSAGGGFTHTLGCERGNVLRGIAPVAGSLLNRDNCIGQVAVMQTHGVNDTIVPMGMIKPSRDYWIAINGCTKEETSEGFDPVCVDYGGCDSGFPVQYCEHDGGHEWPDFASSAIWTFFKSLPPSAPSDETGSGDIQDLGKGVISFKIHYPSDFVGTPEKMALALYPYGITPPISVAPSFILSADVPLGDYTFGEVTEYNNVAINMLGLDFGDYTLTVLIYVEGGSYPMPTHGKDYQGLQNITIGSMSLVVETPFVLEFVEMGF